MSRKELIPYLEKEWGINVTPRQVKRWICEHKIPFVRLNSRTVQFPHRLIVPWIKRQTKGPQV